jgi:exoribonuclease-2
MYGIYNDFQRHMERYWCLRWLQQEQGEEELVVTATVLRENLVKLTDIPLAFRASSLPELPANTRVQLAITGIDLLDVNVETRYVATMEETA